MSWQEQASLKQEIQCWSLQAACHTTSVFHHLLGTGCMQMETTYYGMVNNLSILLGKVPSEPIRGKDKDIPLHIVIEQL